MHTYLEAYPSGCSHHSWVTGLFHRKTELLVCDCCCAWRWELWKNSFSVGYSFVGPRTISPTGTHPMLCRCFSGSSCKSRVPDKGIITFLDDCYSYIGSGTQAALASKGRRLRGVPWAEVAKIREPDTCSSFLLGDNWYSRADQRESAKTAHASLSLESVPAVSYMCLQLDVRPPGCYFNVSRWPSFT